ncbi:MAG: DUF1552 domain-containing protein [Akkermansiaceae bacterium]|nr:DUF1552 domain-containing protein [Akkermansiaceae bacterium]NNM30478.1 DUF1552 domain-containing protein [Akkermansiaceae bacterium]
MSTSPSQPASRRYFLKSAGVTLALPALESLTTSILGAGRSLGATVTKAAPPTRLVAIGNLLGFYQPEFFPQRSGADYAMPRLLKPLKPHRRHFTLFSGLDHGVKGGHFAVHSFLSGVLQMDAKGLPDGNISLDQRAAESVGSATRFPSLTIGSETGIHGGCQMCWTRSGTRVPPIPGPRELFRKLFINDNARDIERARDRFHLKESILDAVHGDAKSLERRLDRLDREKLDEYFTSVREVEKQLELSRHWADVPKPKAPIKEPRNTNMVDDLPLLYDLMALALQTDSTRIATLEIGGDFESRYFDIRKGYHSLSHHGKLQENIDQLLVLEEYQMKQFARFLGKLRSIPDGGGSLLDHTQVLFGSGMANANAHTNLNLPVILAGGGFRHGQHRKFPNKGVNRVPLCNLYVSLLQRFGLETDRFGTSTGALL